MKAHIITLPLVLALSIVLASAAQAQMAGFPPGLAAAPTIPAAPPPPAQPPHVDLTPAQAQQALAVLKDDAKRAQVIGVLEAVARASPPTASAAAADTAPASASAPVPKLVIPLAPDSLGAQVLVDVSKRLSTLTVEIVHSVRSVSDFPLISRWLVHLTTDADSQAALIATGWKLGVVMSAAIATEWLVRWALRRPLRSLENHAPEGKRRLAEDETPSADDSPNSPVKLADPPEPTGRHRRRPTALLLLRRLPFVLGHFVLEILPQLGVIASGYAALGSGLVDDDTTRLVILAVLNAYLVCRLIMCMVRLFMSPFAPRLRLVGLSDEAAAYITRWLRRLVIVAVFGYAMTEVALLFGLYRAAHDALLKLVALVDHSFLVVIVVQSRARVAAAIRARPDARGVVAMLRNRFAAIWHIVAIFYIVALWLVWAFAVQDGFSRLIRIFLSTVIIGTVARLLTIAAVGALDRVLTLKPEMVTRYPGLEARVRSYNPVGRACISSVMGFITVVALFQAWGIDSVAWFESGALGGRLVSAMITIGATLLISLAVWELSNIAIQAHLARLARESQAARSARIRTLLPMFRTTLLVSICTVASLMALSEIGVNIAPLLAGAGVIGLAIGFGSQKLVQDIITGLFLLLENAMQVGDVVSLGGLSGTVENLSIRTIRLRALDGSVHIVPFSAVTTVTNMTRDFGYAVIDVSVGLNEEPDRVIEVLRDIARKMRDEPRWENALRDDLDVMGVEKFIDTAWVLRVRIKTLPAQRWAVLRELNRRIKYQFDELAIESPFTSHRVLSTIPGPTIPVSLTVAPAEAGPETHA